MRHAGDGVHGRRLRRLIVVLWSAGLGICEALVLAEADLDPRRGSLLVWRGKGGRRREVGTDNWAWEQLEPWLQARVELPVGPLFCVVTGPTCGWPWSAGGARSELRRVAREARARRRFTHHQLRHAHAVEMAREGVPLLVIQRQLGHTNLGITSIYFQASTPSTRAAHRWFRSTARFGGDAATGGGKNPSAANKQAFEGQVSGGGSFEPKNGRVQAILATGPLQAPQFTCPSGQRRSLAAVSYAHVVLTDTSKNVSTAVPDASRTFVAVYEVL